METRYQLTNRRKNTFVEAPYNDDGKKRLEHFRKLNPNDWKHCRITSIIQALPSKINYYQVYKFNE